MYNLTKEQPISKFFLYQITKPFTFKSASIGFLCIIDGEVDFSSPQRSYRLGAGNILLLKEEGDIVVSSPNEALILAVAFDCLFFRQSFGADYANLDCNPFEYPDRDYPKLLSALANLALALINDPVKNRFLIRRQVYTLFHILKAEYVCEKRETTTNRQEAKLSQFTEFVDRSCTQALSLQDAADYMGYTPQYLSSFIKKNLQCTFNAYLNDARLKKALLLIKYRNDSTAKIAAICGFSNCAAFEKLFQEKYRVTPLEYRADYQSRLVLDEAKATLIKDHAVIRDKLLNLVRFVEDEPKSIATPLRRQHTFDVTDAHPYERNWDKIINLGDASSFDRPNFRYHVARVQKAFHFAYGRFGGILRTTEIFFSDDDPQDKSRWSFNFSRAFQALDFLMQCGLKPQLDFGGKPFDIYLMTGRSIYGSHQEYVEYLELVLEKFLCTCINRYGFDTVNTWRFEYWLHHDHLHSVADSPESYCREFSFFYHTVKRHLPDAMVGGPGFNLTFPVSVLQDTLQVMLGNGLRPDFVPVLFYPYDVPADRNIRESFAIRLTKNPNELYEKASRVYRVLKSLGCTDIPVFVTEYSNIVSSMVFTNDSVYQGCNILKQTLDNLGHVPEMAYFLATDYSMNYPDSAELLFGGNGLLTKDGIPKPGYYAYLFLTALGDLLIGKGENFIVTRAPRGEIQVILYNYTHFSDEYCDNPRQYNAVRNPDSAFRNTPPVVIDLELTNMTAGSYKISRYLLNEEHGSILNAWMKMDYARHIIDREIDHLEKNSTTELTISRADVTDTLHISQKLERNEAILYIIHQML